MSEINEKIESLERFRKDLAAKRENLEKSYKAHSEFDQKTTLVKKKLAAFFAPSNAPTIENWMMKFHVLKAI